MSPEHTLLEAETREKIDQKPESSEATILNSRIVRQEGSRQLQREVDHYNLDMVTSVGYRVKSKKAPMRWILKLSL